MIVKQNRRVMEEEVKVINKALASIKNKMAYKLNQPHIDVVIEFGGDTYHFKWWDAAEERDFQNEDIQELTEELIIDAINAQLTNHDNAWSRLLGIYNSIADAKDVQSPIVSEEYDVIRKLAETKKEIALNEENYSVQVELGKEIKIKRA